MQNKKISALILLLLVACSGNGPKNAGTPLSKSAPEPVPALGSELVKFGSQKEFDDFIGTLEKANLNKSDGSASFDVASVSPNIASSDQPPSNTTITNNQEAGVDEGGIVKNYKDFLVILRRGKLVTAKISEDKKLSLTANISVASEGLNSKVWYDELLLHGNLAVVIGYRWHSFSNYMKGLTELNFFRIDDAGNLSRVSTHFVESSDYYSWKNYTGRLVNGKLVFYIPYSAFLYREGKYTRNVPHMYQYREGGNVEEGKPLFAGTDVYQSVQNIYSPTFHTLVACDLQQIESFSCSGRAILADWGREYYVSPTTTYLWVDDNSNKEKGIVYSLSLDQLKAGYIRVPVQPIDQFSFSETENGLSIFGYPLYKQCGEDPLSLVNIPSAAASTKGEGDISIHCIHPAEWGNAYRWGMVNRFTKSHLVFGSGKKLLTLDIVTRETSAMDLPHSLERLEPAGSKVLAIGSERGAEQSWKLGISAITFARRPEVSNTHWLENSLQGEWRSHAFLFSGDEKEGYFGLATTDSQSHSDWLNTSASISLFQIRRDEDIVFVQTITAKAFGQPGKECNTSCVDWYGNTRPIFLRDAVCGLLGDQLSCGEWDATGQIVIKNHLNIATGEVIMEES